MTDEPPTDLGTVWMTGQRRRPDGSFPQGAGSAGGGGNSGGVQQNQTPSPDPSPPTDPQYSPCDHPESALEWNADAAAVEAKNEFQSRAAARQPPEDLNTREWGAALFQMPNGRVQIGNITSGEFTFRNPGPNG